MRHPVVHLALDLVALAPLPIGVLQHPPMIDAEDCSALAFRDPS